MSITDKNSGKNIPLNKKDLAQNALDAGGLQEKAAGKLSELASPVTDAAEKVQETASRAKQSLAKAEKVMADITEAPRGFTNYEIIPHEEYIKQAGSFYASYGGDPELQLKNSHIVYTTVQIAGEQVLKNEHYTLSIHQQAAEHDRFEIQCGADAFDARTSYPLTQARHLLGKRITIQFKQFGQSANIFTGIITDITNRKTDGYSHLVISGKSPSILLENGMDCQSFEQKTLEEIIKEATAEYPSDVLEWDIRPNLKESLLYTVQYRESDWQFIRRLARRYGEWLYYNGQQLVFGGWGGKTVDIVEEQDMHEFNLRMRLVPQKFSYIGYDAQQAMPHTVQSDDVPLQEPVNPFQFQAMKASEEVYSKVPLSLYNQSLLEKGEIELKQAVKRQKQNRQNVFFLEAKTNNPNLRLGDIVRVKAWMPGHDIFKNGEVPLESYRVVEINHYQDITEGYYNRLVGVPKENFVPLYMDEDAIPACEEQSAIVMDNNDPKGMSRIRVQFPWQKPFNGMTPWIRSTTPYAGKGKGMHVVPEVGEEVIISFENGNAEKPVSIGALFNGQGKSGHGGAGNYNKGLQTASGNKLLMNDQTGSVLLTDKGTASMKMDGAGITTIDSQDKIILTCGASTIEMHKDGKIKINGKEIKIEGEDKIETETKKHSTTGLDVVTTKSNTLIKEESPKITMNAEGQVEIKSGQTIDVESTISNIKGSGSVNLN